MHEKITKEILEEKYIRDGKSTYEIAKELNVSASCIARRMKKLEIPFRTFKTNTIDLSNMVFGHLTVIKQLPGNRVGAIWLCKCECGTEKSIPASTLKHGLAKSCGKCQKNIKYGVIPHRIIETIKSNAKQRNIDYNIDNEYLSDLFIKQNGLCDYTGIEIYFAETLYDHQCGFTTASLDRINSTIGYIKGNVHWIHKDINFMKRQFSEDKFLYYIENIYNNRLRNKSCVTQHLF